MSGWRIERKQLMNELVIRVGISVILIGLALYDLKRCLVPNLVVMPLLVTVIPLNTARFAAGTIALGHIGLIALAWAVCLFLWAMRVFGGGDVKLAMALIGMFPEIRLVNILVGVLVIGHFAILLNRDGWTGFRQLKAIILDALVTRKLPTPAEIQAAALAQRSPVTYLISGAGLIYLWLAYFSGAPVL
jgi:Flp pilus assembly protein protease CpaA